MPNEAGITLKLPAPQVAALLASGDGLPFDAGKGRPMTEWVVVSPRSDDLWTRLANDARAFVGPRSSPSPSSITDRPLTKDVERSPSPRD